MRRLFLMGQGLGTAYVYLLYGLIVAIAALLPLVILLHVLDL